MNRQSLFLTLGIIKIIAINMKIRLIKKLLKI